MVFAKLGLGAVFRRPGSVLGETPAMLNIKVVTWSLAIWAALMFVSCVVYGLLTPSSLHMTAFLEQLLPGYKPLSGVGFFVGLIQSFLYGAFAGLVYVPVYNFLNRNFSARGFR